MKTFLRLVVVFLAILLFNNSAFAFSWFFGDGTSGSPTENYVANHTTAATTGHADIGNGITGFFIPIYVDFDEGETLGGAGFPTSAFLLDGVPADYVTWGPSSNTVWSSHTTDGFILTGLEVLVTDWANNALQDGLYTGVVGDITGIILGVYDSDGNYGWVAPDNNFAITLGSPVPIPSSVLLFGLGILGLAGINRRK